MQKILIVEDDTNINNLLQEALSKEGYSCEQAFSGTERQRLVDNFQTNPHCKVAIGTIGAMGTGLTLNKASYVFFMDKAWNSGDNAQAEDRAHRIGTVGAVNVISMVAKGTIDEAVEDYLLENKDLIDRVVDGKGSKQDIKTILNKLLSRYQRRAGYECTE